MEVRRRRSEKKPSLKQLETYWTPQPLFFQDIPFGAHLVASPSLEKIWGLDCAGPKNCTSCEQGFALVQVDLGKRAYGTRHAFSPWKNPGSPTFYWILVVEWRNPYIGFFSSPQNRVVYPKRFFSLLAYLENFHMCHRGKNPGSHGSGFWWRETALKSSLKNPAYRLHSEQGPEQKPSTTNHKPKQRCPKKNLATYFYWDWRSRIWWFSMIGPIRIDAWNTHEHIYSCSHQLKIWEKNL